MLEPTPELALNTPPRRDGQRVDALFHGHIIASSTDVIDLDGQRYFPKADVGMSYLRPVDTLDDVYGTATRYTIYRDGEVIESAAWSYEQPRAGHEALTGRIAFRDQLVRYEVTAIAPGDQAAARESRSWDVNQPSQRDGATVLNTPDGAPAVGAESADIEDVVRHTDSGSGSSQAEHWAPNVSGPDDRAPAAPHRPYNGTGSI